MPHPPNSRSAVGLSGPLTCVLSQRESRAFRRHSCLEKRNLIGDMKTKPLLASLGLWMPWDLWPWIWGGNVALSLPRLPPSAPHAGDRFTRASSGLQVEAGATEKNGTLSHHPQRGLLGSDTPRGGEVKGQPSRQWRQKRGLCGGRISPAAPLPCLVTPWGHRQAGGHTPAGSTSRQKLLR